MNYITVDFEFNQPFDFKTGQTSVLNTACPFEIIQMGAVKLNEKRQIKEQFSTCVHPEIYKRLHPYVEKLTGIQEDDLKNAPGFTEAFLSFCRFINGKNNVMCTWGHDDIKVLHYNLKYYKIKINKLFQYFINVQKAAGLFCSLEQNNQMSLKNAVISLDIDVSLGFHNALNDAYYTALIFQKMPLCFLLEEVYRYKPELDGKKGIKKIPKSFKMKYSQTAKI